MAKTILFRNLDIGIITKLRQKAEDMFLKKKIGIDPQLFITKEEDGYAIGSTAPEYEDLAFIAGLLLGLYHGDIEA